MSRRPHQAMREGACQHASMRAASSSTHTVHTRAARAPCGTRSRATRYDPGAISSPSSTWPSRGGGEGEGTPLVPSITSPSGWSRTPVISPTRSRVPSRIWSSRSFPTAATTRGASTSRCARSAVRNLNSRSAAGCPVRRGSAGVPAFSGTGRTVPVRRHRHGRHAERRHQGPTALHEAVLDGPVAPRDRPAVLVAQACASPPDTTRRPPPTKQRSVSHHSYSGQDQFEDGP